MKFKQKQINKQTNETMLLSLSSSFSKTEKKQ